MNGTISVSVKNDYLLLNTTRCWFIDQERGAHNFNSPRLVLLLDFLLFCVYYLHLLVMFCCYFVRQDFVSSGRGTAYHTRVLEFITGVRVWVRVAQYSVFCSVVCRSLFVRWFFIVFPSIYGFWLLLLVFSNL